MGLRWEGFRNLRGQVCKRLARHLREMGIPDLSTYRAYLMSHPDEWGTLSALCRVTISRFYRDQQVWDRLCSELLPATMSRAADRGDRVIHAWSVGCASGEEPYTLALAWKFSLASRVPGAVSRNSGYGH